MKKPLNHLASTTEQLANYRLPHQKQLLVLQELTLMVRAAWQDLLTPEILSTLSVIFYDQDVLSISTNNHTLANHLTYNRKLLLEQLQAAQPAFAVLTQLRFRVIVLDPIGGAKTLLQCNQNVNNVKKRELSESTKRNIAQLAELVTDDLRLKQALQNLIKSSER